LSRRYALLLVLKAKVLGFHSIKAFYIADESFKKMAEDLSLYNSFTLKEGFFFFKFKGNYISKSPLSDLIVKEAYEGALAG